MRHLFLFFLSRRTNNDSRRVTIPCLCGFHFSFPLTRSELDPGSVLFGTVKPLTPVHTTHMLPLVEGREASKAVTTRCNSTGLSLFPGSQKPPENSFKQKVR
ncbi:hypothetical protein LCGC14_2315470 [marine sediment metagenome]|uniref:Uncharacterized protein n=1 Tax=marine sediment metagenome TaxID=412755 RepID=A0A0F9CJY6_9ZZZZ